MDEFNNVFSRFFIRNIIFFRTTKRLQDFNFVKSTNYKDVEAIKNLPSSYQELLNSIFYDSNSQFTTTYNEISNIPFNSLGKECKELVKTLK